MMAAQEARTILASYVVVVSKLNSPSDRFPATTGRIQNQTKAVVNIYHRKQGTCEKL